MGKNGKQTKILSKKKQKKVPMEDLVQGFLESMRGNYFSFSIWSPKWKQMENCQELQRWLCAKVEDLFVSELAYVKEIYSEIEILKKKLPAYDPALELAKTLHFLLRTYIVISTFWLPHTIYRKSLNCPFVSSCGWDTDVWANFFPLYFAYSLVLKINSSRWEKNGLVFY